MRERQPVQRGGQPRTQVPRLRGALARQALPVNRGPRYVYETANMNFQPGQPFVGTSAFAHKGGNARARCPQERRELRAYRPGGGGQ